MIRVGLIGAGFMGSMHSNVYSLLPDAKLVAVCDLDLKRAEELAQSHGAKVYTDADELLHDDALNLDLVDICLPTLLHTEYALKAAKLGFNILCEKPFTLDLESADKIIAATEEAQVEIMVGQCIRFWPEYQYLKEAVEKKTFGEVQGAWFSRLSPLPTWGWENWLLDPARSGGAAFDMHIHDTDFILYLLGKPQAVTSRGVIDQYGMSHISTQYKYDDLMVVGECGWNYPASFPFKMQYRVICQQAVISFDGTELLVYPYDADSYKVELAKEATEGATSSGNISDLGGYFNEIKYYIDCLSQNQSPQTVTAESAKQSVAVTRAELESAKKGKTIIL